MVIRKKWPQSFRMIKKCSIQQLLKNNYSGHLFYIDIIPEFIVLKIWNFSGISLDFLKLIINIKMFKLLDRLIGRILGNG